MNLLHPFDLEGIAVVGPGRLGTAWAYKFGRDGRGVIFYYHDAQLCRAITRDHLNPRHLTADLGLLLGGTDRVPRLSPRVRATNDLAWIVAEYDVMVLALTMNRLPEFLHALKPLLRKRETPLCLISPLKGLIADEITRRLITPSRLIHSHLREERDKYELVCVGGPFFDVDIALGRPVCVTMAGRRGLVGHLRRELMQVNRRELYAYYNYDQVGVEACGALKNIVANIKGLSDCLDLGNSFPGTLFARSGVEVRALSRRMGGSFQAFVSQAGIGDMYVTLSSTASKNYRYGRAFYERYTGNAIETHRRVLETIDGTPEGPHSLQGVQQYLEKMNMYSPLFRCAYDVFNGGGHREDIRERIIRATHFDRRSQDYISPLSRLFYRIFPHLWYRRERGPLSWSPKLDPPEAL